jgi:hypothetical protein
MYRSTIYHDALPLKRAAQLRISSSQARLFIIICLMENSVRDSGIATLAREFENEDKPIIPTRRREMS